MRRDLGYSKQFPILELAKRLGIKVVRHKALCFSGHDIKTPSLHFYEESNSWKCFGSCGKSGDTILLVQEVLGLGFIEAVDWIEGKSSVSRQNLPAQPKQGHPKSEKIKRDPELYRWFIDKCGSVSRDEGVRYLQEHSISSENALKHRICELRSPERALIKALDVWGASRLIRSGIATKVGEKTKLIWNSYCILFPFIEQGEVTYIQARLLGSGPKFIGLRGLPPRLYNIDILAGLEPGAIVHLCEGIPDCLAAESIGLNAMAVLGATNFKPEWVDYFWNYTVRVLPDGDQGGKTFAELVQKNFKERGKSVSVVPVQKNLDVADVVLRMRDRDGSD